MDEVRAWECCKNRMGSCADVDCNECELYVYDDSSNDIYNNIYSSNNNTLYSSYGVQSPTIDKFSHKARRYIVRAFRGVACGVIKGYRFRWFVVTESDDALAKNIVFGKEWNKFITWLRKVHCRDFQYDAVEHRQGEVSKVTGERRRNWHILSYGSDKLPVLDMRDYWIEHYKSTITGMEEVHRVEGAIKYMAGYLSDAEKFQRSWCSQGWVFPGWLGWSKWYKKKYEKYPDADMIKELSLMSDSERKVIMEGYNPVVVKKREKFVPMSGKFFDSQGNELLYKNGVYSRVKGTVIRI